MLDEEALHYVGSICLGSTMHSLNLQEFTNGFTLALSDNKIISLVGLVTGISAALSMAASDYLSSKAEGDRKHEIGCLYRCRIFFTVILLILPFLVITNKFLALGITLATAILIIFVFNYYISTAKTWISKHDFWKWPL